MQAGCGGVLLPYLRSLCAAHFSYLGIIRRFGTKNKKKEAGKHILTLQQYIPRSGTAEGTGNRASFRLVPMQLWILNMVPGRYCGATDRWLTYLYWHLGRTTIMQGGMQASNSSLFAYCVYADNAWPYERLAFNAHCTPNTVVLARVILIHANLLIAFHRLEPTYLLEYYLLGNN